MALICFHSSRSDSRLTAEGEIILLPMQDRSKWDHALIAQGNLYMNKAAFGNAVSTYHIEAAIAYEHCIASSYNKTNWKQILTYYEWLCAISTSPVCQLNKTIAVMKVHGSQAALQHLNTINDKKLEDYYLYYSLLGEIHAQLHNSALAKDYYEVALSMTRSETERTLLRNKIGAILN